MNEAKRLEFPTEGGSYHRLPDGSLEKRNQTPKDEDEAAAQIARDKEVAEAHAAAAKAAVEKAPGESTPADQASSAADDQAPRRGKHRIIE